MGRLRSHRATARRPLILADTSAWVEFDRQTGSPIHHRLAELIRPRSGLVVAAPVVAEVAMGARSDRREQDLRDLLALFPRLRLRHDLDAGAAVYRECRRSGVTPGGLVDCTIAAIAMRYDAALLTSDIGQARIARVVPLRLDPAGVQP